jgi:hypothetical protein
VGVRLRLWRGALGFRVPEKRDLVASCVIELLLSLQLLFARSSLNEQRAALVAFLTMATCILKALSPYPLSKAYISYISSLLPSLLLVPQPTSSTLHSPKPHNPVHPHQSINSSPNKQATMLKTLTPSQHRYHQFSTLPYHQLLRLTRSLSNMAAEEHRAQSRKLRRKISRIVEHLKGEEKLREVKSDIYHCLYDKAEDNEWEDCEMEMGERVYVAGRDERDGSEGNVGTAGIQEVKDMRRERVNETKKEGVDVGMKDRDVF